MNQATVETTELPVIPLTDTLTLRIQYARLCACIRIQYAYIWPNVHSRMSVSFRPPASLPVGRGDLQRMRNRRWKE